MDTVQCHRHLQHHPTHTPYAEILPRGPYNPHPHHHNHHPYPNTTPTPTPPHTHTQNIEELISKTMPADIRLSGDIDGMQPAIGWYFILFFISSYCLFILYIFL